MALIFPGLHPGYAFASPLPLAGEGPGEREYPKAASDLKHPLPNPLP